MRLLVIGAGGHAKVVIDAARAAGFEIAGVVAEIAEINELLGVPVSVDRHAFEADAFIIAMGDNVKRAEAFSRYHGLGLEPATVVHPRAVLAPGVTPGPGALIAAGVLVNVDAAIGANSILNTGCTVDHDCVIGDHAHIGPGVNLCGAVRIGTGALLGVGACAIPGACVGDWAVVGAGSAVVGDVPAHATWGGVPARALRSGDAS